MAHHSDIQSIIWGGAAFDTFFEEHSAASAVTQMHLEGWKLHAIEKKWAEL